MLPASQEQSTFHASAYVAFYCVAELYATEPQSRITGLCHVEPPVGVVICLAHVAFPRKSARFNVRTYHPFHQPPSRCVVISEKSAQEDYPRGYLLDVSNNASLTFNGDVAIEEVENLGSVLTNAGNTE